MLIESEFKIPSSYKPKGLEINNNRDQEWINSSRRQLC